MSIQISAEIEVRLTEEARRLGISVEALLARLVNGRRTTTEPDAAKPELPEWDLGVIGAMHRRDIYEDGR